MINRRDAATSNSCARFGGDHFFGEAGTEVGCGIDDAHREWHRNRFLLLQIYLITLLQGPAVSLTHVNAGIVIASSPLGEQARIDSHDSRNPFFRMLQIIGHMRGD